MSAADRIAYREHVLEAESTDHDHAGKRVIYEAWRQYRTKLDGAWKDGSITRSGGETERGFGPTLELALTDLLRAEHYYDRDFWKNRTEE